MNQERVDERAFSVFEEGIIRFPPTYKYDPGTGTFDTSEKKRTPSWCDRILWRKNDPTALLRYRTAMQLVTSDHKPVSALLSMKIKLADKTKRSQVYLNILRELDKFENESLPDVVISSNHLDFGDVYYSKPVTKYIVIENVGHVIAQFRFVPKLDDTHLCAPWAWINPPTSMLLPGKFIVYL